MIKSYFINLNRRKDRLQNVLKQLELINFKSKRFEAFDGKTLTGNSKELEIFKNNTFNYRQGVMGAALSHIKLWEKLVNSNKEYFLIFEDDITFVDNFLEHYEDVNKILNNKKIDFLLLGFHTSVYKDSTDTEVSAIIEELYNNPKKIIDMNDNIRNKTWGGLFAYIIHRDTAISYLDEIYKNNLTEPIDIFIFKKNISIYNPSIVKSPVMTWSNKADSDIQYDIISMFDEFVFFQYKDSVGNDIRWSNANTPEQLKKEAEEEPNCVAFNTYAWLKYDICHPDKFIIMPGMNSNAHGIYVKKSKLKEFGYY
ncbi:glycosyltransferase family 25 [Hokovirus HKV1]|uniref:Glycosyltransferase family 25 n=1 Tax=Hokovirus HKV1 TaxID=1977638 RepID=A0A1V0SF51_9VIRU|nr:glycosyltransferase family 25 [Hokovirus HKV1]